MDASDWVCLFYCNNLKSCDFLTQKYQITIEKNLENDVLGVQIDIVLQQLRIGPLPLSKVLLAALFFDALDDCLERDPPEQHSVF